MPNITCDWYNGLLVYSIHQTILQQHYYTVIIIYVV